MHHKILPALLGMFFLTVLAIGLVPSVRAEADALTVKGVIHTINLKAKTLTVEKADKTTVTFNYNNLTVIQRNGAIVKVKSLALQDKITVKHKASMLAVKFAASGPKTGKVSGMLSNAVKGTGLVTIGAKSVKTTAQTRISRNGKIVSLSQLTRQDAIVSHTKPVVTNAPSGPAQAEDIIAQGPEDDQVYGSITAINSSQVTITPKNGTPDITVNVTAATMIELDGASAALTDLALGMQVETHFDPVTFDAFSIETDSAGESDDAHVTGTVAALDLVAGSVTITPTTGTDVPVSIDAATEIQVNDRAGTLEDMTVGMPIRAEFDMTTLVAKEINAGADDYDSQDEHVEGTVAGVDEVNATVTITPNGGGADVTLNVTTETDIEVNGVNASLVSITVGLPVGAEYDPTNNNAFEIEAGTDDGGGSGGEEEGVDGTVSAVDTTNSKITITPDGGGSDIVLIVTNGTEIEVNDAPGTLADIQTGDTIRAKYIGATLEATEIKVGGS